MQMCQLLIIFYFSSDFYFQVTNEGKAKLQVSNKHFWNYAICCPQNIYNVLVFEGFFFFLSFACLFV